ncbi:acetyl-CoA carboxylase biotin carboxyl carrier protein subunit [Nguyenibacter sp. L1]|uniref:acetyl-CoA carboxylase biotin carboxyl carrier protein n=1 Tax=Nguyenibacter sp. L1 TaxID=3049350 RepID=UPI002B48DBAD|nr:acetyl-CoA carboxylase biotin carboxyl carrier protein subunit [Nguyenibacter sp. L1]WRH89775.1 acetyl-CoA carboxylase biotin carboxyl carrier protein subunit [Nguyenibacter sp. L1]
MEFEFIKRVLDLAVRRGITVLTLERQGLKIRIERRESRGVSSRSDLQPPDVPAQDETPSPSAMPAPHMLQAVKAPMTGVIHLSPKPGEPHFVSVGDKVTKGQQVAIIEAMKTFSAIKAPCSGHVQDIAVGNGDEVDGGIDIMRIHPSDEVA